MYLLDIYKRHLCCIMLFPLGSIYKIAKLSPHIMSKRMLEIAGRNTFLYYSVIHTEKKKKKAVPFKKNLSSLSYSSSFIWMSWDSATGTIAILKIFLCSIFFFKLKSAFQALQKANAFGLQGFLALQTEDTWFISFPFLCLKKIHYYVLLAPQWEYTWFIFCYLH